MGIKLNFHQKSFQEAFPGVRVVGEAVHGVTPPDPQVELFLNGRIRMYTILPMNPTNQLETWVKAEDGSQVRYRYSDLIEAKGEAEKQRTSVLTASAASD